MQGPGRGVRTAWAAALLAVAPAQAQTRLLMGRVTMEDGSPPSKPVGIERNCGAGYGTHETTTDRQGRFIVRWLIGDPASAVSSFGYSMVFLPGMSPCLLRATLSGFVSTTYDLNQITAASDPHLPPLVLRSKATTVEVDAEKIPSRARRPWERGMQASQAGKWAEAERELRAAVAAAPRFAHGWNLLGGALVKLKKLPEARDAFQHAIAADPKLLLAYAMLARVTVAERLWNETLTATGPLIRMDTQHAWLEGYYHDALARYNLRDYAGSQASARELLRLDSKHAFPEGEYILGMALAATRDFSNARQHLGAYLALAPKSSEAPVARQHLEHLGENPLEDAPLELNPADARLGAAGEVWIPGGMRALAAMVGIDARGGSAGFFADYCRALVRRITPGAADSISGVLSGLTTYFQIIAELERFGEHRGDRTVIRLSLGLPETRRETARVLELLGWKVSGDSIELADGPGDGPRQRIPAALGIDPIAVRQALEARLPYTFEIVSENARLSGGQAWVAFTGGAQTLAGGLAQSFAAYPRLARAYAALGGMGDDTAAAVVAGIGLRAAVGTYSGVLWRYGDALGLAGSAAAVPGGAAAETAWARLAGAGPRDPPAFFRAVLQKDGGRLMAFYRAVARADAAHQRYFTASPARLARYYKWTQETPEAVGRLAELPLGASGEPHFPGGKAAWGIGEDDAVLMAQAEALAATARLERERGAPLDEASARLLARHFAEWKPLWRDFEGLPGLGSGEFEALAAFAEAVRALEPRERNTRLGEWYALVELARLAERAGTLDARQSAEAFRRACLELRGRGGAAPAREVLAAMGGNSDDAVRDRLLRLEGPRRAAFDQILELQHAPGLAAARTDEDALAALSGLVYAAWLDPDWLPLREDPGFLRRHRFSDEEGLFALAALERSSKPPGSRFRGGFADFDEAAGGLPRAGPSTEAAAAGDPPPATPGPRQLEPAPRTESLFHAEARLVEVYATVTDARGRYVDNLPQAHFELLEEGAPQRVAAFESQSSGVSVALLLDTTGSMARALPALKNAAMKLIRELREMDQVAVYSFAEDLHRLQAFTGDKQSAERAVLRTHAAGETALYDALARVAREISGRSGKKVIVVFTDGADNRSVLTAEAAIRRAKNTGAPVYTVAEGAALGNKELMQGLAAISQATGGMAFAIREPGEIRGVLERVAQDLMHGYLLVFTPPPVRGNAWRRIGVRLTSGKDYRVRAREGYYPE